MPYTRLVRGAILGAFAIAPTARAQSSTTCRPAPVEAPPCPVGALTLADAVALALKQGLSAEASRDVLAQARARDRAFNARLMPQVSLDGTSANYNHAISGILQPTGETRFLPQSQS